MNIPDNYELWEAHDREQEKALSDSIHCEYCGKPIQEDFFFEINGDVMCESCLVRNFRKENVF